MLSWFSLGWVYHAPGGCPITEQSQEGPRANAAPVAPGSHHLAQRMVGWRGLAAPSLPLWSVQRKHRMWNQESACLVWTPALLQNSCVALDKLANLTLCLTFSWKVGMMITMGIPHSLLCRENVVLHMKWSDGLTEAGPADLVGARVSSHSDF